MTGFPLSLPGGLGVGLAKLSLALAGLKGMFLRPVAASEAFNPEAALGSPDLVQAPGNFDITPPANGREQAVFAFDVTFPDDPVDNVQIFENGGGGRGIMVMTTGAHMRFRFGSGRSQGELADGDAEGGAFIAGRTVYVDVPYAALPWDGGLHTLVWQIDPRSGQLKSILWIDGVQVFDFRPAGNVESNQWTGGANGTFLGNAATNIVGETAHDGQWPDTTDGEMRTYLSKAVV